MKQKLNVPLAEWRDETWPVAIRRARLRTGRGERKVLVTTTPKPGMRILRAASHSANGFQMAAFDFAA